MSENPYIDRPMTDRERFLATMNYQPRDRAMICDFGFWDETPGIWREQGLPEGLHAGNLTNWFGMDRYDEVNVGGHTSLLPSFEHKVIEDRGDQEVVQQGDGVRVLRHKTMSSIPVHLGHLLTDRQSWEEHFKHRLDPNTPGRFWSEWENHIDEWKDPNRPFVTMVGAGSLYGELRSWMGVEQISYIVYDDPTLFEEMVETCADCIIGVLQKVFDAGIPVDAAGMWEDMCYNAGPLLSPSKFEEVIVPHLRRVVDVLHKNGVKVIWVDCDGKIDHLLPLWLDNGVNCMFPLEIGTWGTDPVKYRKEYGKDLLMMGGFSKLTLAESKEAIEKEIHRLTPLVDEGGFIPFCDHRVPPTVPYEYYVHYLRTARKVWGRDFNLKPFPQIDL